MSKHKYVHTDVLGLFEKIIGRADTKFGVLVWFLLNRKDTVYPARLAGLLSRPEPSVRQALHLLTRKGILKSIPTAYRHYFRLNPLWPRRYE
jgi:hypothetical protein